MANLSQIQTFIEVAQTESFAEASRRLSLPRSTVSARVSALEERLNVRLLHRTTRRVSLTPEGSRYMEICQETINRLTKAEDELSRTDILSGTIRVTIPVDMSKSNFASAILTFMNMYPLLHIEVLVTDETLNLVKNNIDLALRGGAPGTAGLVARKIGIGKLAFFASHQYARDNIEGEMLKSLAGHVFFDPTKHAKDLAVDTKKPRINTQNFQLIKELVIQSQGIAFLPESICNKDVLEGKLIKLEFEAILPPLEVYIVMPTRHHMPKRVRVFIDFLVSAHKKSFIF